MPAVEKGATSFIHKVLAAAVAPTATVAAVQAAAVIFEGFSLGCNFAPLDATACFPKFGQHLGIVLSIA